MSEKVLIDGEWRVSAGTSTFQALNPTTGEIIDRAYPVSPWEEIDAAVHAADRAAREMRGWPGSRFAAFLNAYADEIEARSEALVAAAHEETALPAETRLAGIELPRTTGQLRQAAKAATECSWSSPTIDTATNIRSMLGPLGPVAVFGPNNFPFAFNGIAGGDFAAAVAAGNPLIAKGHSSHPETTRIFAEAALAAMKTAEMPSGFVQLIYRTSHEDGCRFVAHPLIGACGYTGSRHAGLKIKQAADEAGKPAYLELSSINPVVILPGAIAERGDAIADEFTTSCLMGTGQFCTNPGVVVVKAGGDSDNFVNAVTARFSKAAVGTMLSEGVRSSFLGGIEALKKAGATLLTGGETGGGTGVSCSNTLLQVDGAKFLADAEGLQTEAFGNSSLIVVAANDDELEEIMNAFEGNLTGCVYSDSNGADDALYDRVTPTLRQKVGRLLNDKMPTGVAVTAAMNHGGPYPATGHPGFTAVGIPGSIARFGMLQCYDNVREHRLPALLQNKNSLGAWRLVDGEWTKADVG